MPHKTKSTGRDTSGNTALASGKRNTRTLTAWHLGRDCMPIPRKR